VTEMRCPLCAGPAAALTLPHPGQSMLSDGRLIQRPLAKLSCLSCGAAFHASAMSSDEARTIYDDAYTLAGASPKSDAQRARAYRNWISAECAAPRHILEVGCGSGALLAELVQSWPGARGFGLDPALPDTAPAHDGVRLVRGFTEDIPEDAGRFDLIIAVNVIEHTAAPGAFLKALRSHLAPDGRIVIICPEARPPNLELLFFDHLYSLTPAALGAASTAASLAVSKHVPAPREIGNFQMVILEANAASPVTPPAVSPADLRAERQDYLGRWARLDQALLERAPANARLLAFGGGQTAALLRAYAPRTWSRIDAIAVDEPAEAWTLGPAVVPYQDAIRRPGSSMLVATSPHVQALLAERLRRDGLRPIVWNDLISC
jgi:SAM-dependent methyltransferase